MPSAQKRFGSLTLEEREAKQLKLKNKNTLKNEQKVAKAFKNYLEEQGCENTDFCTFTEAELNCHLNTFWLNAKTVKNEPYSASSLEMICYGLNRSLKRYGHNFDITKKECTSFTKSIKAFEDAQKELLGIGKGCVKNYKEIEPHRK